MSFRFRPKNGLRQRAQVGLASLAVGSLLLLPPGLFCQNTAMVKHPLDGDWQFRRVGEDQWHPALVPGCIHLDLMRAGLIPDPFYRDNETKVQWVENEDWEYKKDFRLAGNVLGQDRVELVAEGLDTFASIFLNGHKIGETDNMFRGYRFDIKPHLRSGLNEILIRFDSPVRRARTLEAKVPYKLPGGSPHVRKAPYQFGWDWGPRLVTSGIWRPLVIEAWEGARLENLEIRQQFLDRNKVLLQIRAEVIADRDLKIAVKATVTGKNSVTHSEPVVVRTGWNLNEKSFSIVNPDLWWPAGMGEQNLYTVQIDIYQRGRLLDTVEKRIGLRTLILEQKEDEWGRSFRFVANGVPFFAKGGNWIPADSFPPRVTRRKYETLLRDCREANMNMLRVWGGGIYEADDFYGLCDELGIVVWQDFMFACAMFPGDEAFLENVRAEAEFVVKSLRHHPSIALWCGNNECEEGWFHWGWKDQYPARVWEDYEKIFNGILPAAVDQYDPSRAYWPSSPHSETVGQPRSDRSGDMHYWGIWHGQEPFKEYRKKFHRFFSEFGFQSFPLLDMVKTFTLPEDRNIASPVMEQHQKHPEGNRLILLYMLDHYRLPKDFESLLWMSEVLQAEGMKTAVEHFRSQMPRIMGSLYWQINDCWPVASWSGIDYFGTWKALHYYARRFYRPVHVAAVDDGARLRIYGISDLDQALDATLYVGLFAYDGTPVQEGRNNVRLEPRSSRVLLDKPLDELRQKHPAEEIYLYCELQRGGETLSSNIFHFSELKRVNLPEPDIRSEVVERDGKIIVRLECSRLAKDVYLSASGFNGRFSDNFFDMIPGRRYEVVFIADAPVDPGQFRQGLKLMSLRDTY
jgi:beta-mannosidase